MNKKLEIKKTKVCEFRTKEQLAIKAKNEAKKKKEADRKRHEKNRIDNLNQQIA